MGTRCCRLMRFFISFILLFPALIFAQQPSITSIAPTSLEYGETVTITGDNLTGGTASVFFGSVESTNVTVSGSNLLAEVPSGATHGPITVINNNLTAQSSEHFFIAFGGAGTPSLAVKALSILQTQIHGMYLIYGLCDIDADGLNDVVITNENFDGTETNLAEYTYFINTTTSTSSTTFAAPVTVNLTGSFNNVGWICVCRVR